MKPTGPLKLQVEFSGGMELLFDNQRRCDVQLPLSYALDDLLETGFPSALSEGERPVDLRFLIHWLRHCLLSDLNRPDLFMQGQTVRPGILVLVNDTDWELEGGLDYALQPRDSILFISTLHGG